MIRDEFRALTPWSFFLPIALAVMLGVLVAHALIAVFSGRGGGDDASAAQLAARTEAAGNAREAGADRSNPASATGRTDALAAARAAPALAPVSLPGPSSARRDGEARACIGGTIAVRAENGWEQEVVEDAPARCTASSR
jgi:hypothetical protein